MWIYTRENNIGINVGETFEDAREVFRHFRDREYMPDDMKEEILDALVEYLDLFVDPVEYFWLDDDYLIRTFG